VAANAAGGWTTFEAGRLRRGGREEARGFLEVSSRLSIVEGLAVGATARAGTEGGGSILLWHRSSRRDRGKQAQMINATMPRCHGAKLPAGWSGGGAGALQEYFALLDRGKDAQ
jgi:hypothetical protein